MTSNLLSAKALIDFIGKPDVIIIDASSGPNAFTNYQKQHVVGALFVDLETELSHKNESAVNGGRHPLPDPIVFGKTLGKIGIRKNTHVILYDDKAGGNASARFWWMLKAAGHEKIHVVNGGLNAIQAESIELSKSAVERHPVENYSFDRWLLPIADIHEVERARKNPEALVIDVREAYRYNGEREPIDLVAGHIPGAVNIPFLSNLNEEGVYKSADTLREKYQSIIGNRNPENVIVHCGSGVTACHTVLALEEAGIKNAKLYVGSWSEWSRNEKPIATK